jgi:ABC-type metal ion transport system substrate-binding protein
LEFGNALVVVALIHVMPFPGYREKTDNVQDLADDRKPLLAHLIEILS